MNHEKQEQLNNTLDYYKAWIRLNSVNDPTEWDVLRVADCLSVLPPPPKSINDWISTKVNFLTLIGQLAAAINEPDDDEKNKANSAFIKERQGLQGKKKPEAVPATTVSAGGPHK